MSKSSEELPEPESPFEPASLKEFYRFFSRWEDGYSSGIPIELIQSDGIQSSPVQTRGAQTEGFQRENIDTEGIDKETNKGVAEQGGKSSEMVKKVLETHPDFGGPNLRAIFLSSQTVFETSEDKMRVSSLFLDVVRKGLKWRPEEVELLFIDESGDQESLSDQLKELAEKHSDLWWITVGSIPAPMISSVTDSIIEEQFIQTASFKEILEDRVQKKRFWGDLQALIS